MKKQLLLVCLAAVGLFGSVNAQNYSGLSIQAKGGIGTIRGFAGQDFFDRAFNPEFGGAIEYTFTPAVGLGLEYSYQVNDQKDFTSTIHQALLFSSFNLSNLTAKYRSNSFQKLNIYFNVGGGFGFGDWNTTALPLNSGDVMNLAAALALNFEYDITKDLAVGIEGKYRWNSNGGYNPTQYIDIKDFYTANINLRYKFSGVRNVRNVKMYDYEAIKLLGIEGVQTAQPVAVSPSGVAPVDTTAAVPQYSDVNPYANDTSVKKSDVAFPGMGAAPIEEVAPAPKATSSENTAFESVEGIYHTEKEANAVVMKTESYASQDLKRYSVVVGSFSSMKNAEALATKVKAEGYAAQVLQNEQGMYRVVLNTSNSVATAVAEAKKIRAKYPDAWVLILK